MLSIVHVTPISVLVNSFVRVFNIVYVYRIISFALDTWKEVCSLRVFFQFYHIAQMVITFEGLEFYLGQLALKAIRTDCL